MSLPPRLGFSGRLAAAFQESKLTPLLAITGVLLGLFAVLITPREEEPQINVTFANVFVAFPGASAAEVENLVATPLEQVLAQIEGVKHTYSVSRPGMAVLTVQFEVGENRTAAIVRLYDTVLSHQDARALAAGVQPPLIKPMGIDDVPIVSVTLWTDDATRGAHDLQRVAHALETELKRVPGTRDVYTVGGPDNVVHVQLDPQRLAAYGLSIDRLHQSLAAANVVTQAGAIVAHDTATPVTAGTFLATADDVAELVVGVRDGRPIYLDDVADVAAGPDQPESYVRFGTGPGAGALGLPTDISAPAVTLAIAKKPGTNAVVIAGDIGDRLKSLRGVLIPEGVHATMTRNYGQTADDKARTLIGKLIFATSAVVLLVLLTLGWREAVVVGTAVVITLAVTLFASWAWGFTINRVSLFALIFSIGILVDDAIVVVENIHRHMALGAKSLREAIPPAVDEVGGPTILATFTVIAALLPMAFVSGLMGPYMSPIPINASTGMLLSLAVALIVTPWLALKLLRVHGGGNGHAPHQPAALEPLFQKLVGRFLAGPEGRRARHKLYAGVGIAIVLAVGLAAVRLVVLKMLPFDNKSEFQVVLDMPEGVSVEETAAVLDALAQEVRKVPEVSDYQIYAGTAAPINFNGLVRQYYLRSGDNVGDIQVNLVDKHLRKRHSHDIARDLRPALAAIGTAHGASVKVVEVPPGPPVQAPLVAEVYGPDYAGQLKLATELNALFASTEDLVDVDDTVEAPAPRQVFEVDRNKAALLGVTQAEVSRALAAALGGDDATFIHDEHSKYPVPVRIELPAADKAEADSLLMLRVAGRDGRLVPLAEIVRPMTSQWEKTIYHKDLLPVAFVTGDMAGPLDSPLYGMFRLAGRIGREPPGGHALPQHYVSQPRTTSNYSLKWDGEWQVTYDTFRDMGLAYSVGLILIYLLVVAQFGSYWVPLVIMAPIPLTIIGVMPGHALLGAQFTATSMIGMIALAGIIVRNSILLVDFVNQELAAGATLEAAVVRAGAVRAKPIALTALAAVLGAFFILDDPIFNGLAVALIFGIAVSTLLTLVVIPVLYYAARVRMLARTTDAPPAQNEH
ncbi:MAG TPA: efflux RND transporter permease subunit [Gammaproteobacteria bacterium]|nr:efflux RND transporter permease subunit [Gammaproteobacteria bacterium]